MLCCCMQEPAEQPVDRIGVEHSDTLAAQENVIVHKAVAAYITDRDEMGVTSSVSTTATVPQCDSVPMALPEVIKEESMRPDFSEESTEAIDFKAKLEKGEKVGFKLDTVGGSCAMVMDVGAGAGATYNASVSPELRIRPGDLLMSVNGVSGDTINMARAVAVKNTTLELGLRRPASYYAVIDKEGTSGDLGVTVDYLDDGISLLVTSVVPGLISNWNESNPTKAVESGDRIVCVNGVKGLSAKLLMTCSAETNLTMKFIRP